jgi:hypothetical protein
MNTNTNEITDRHIQQAHCLPTAEAFITYCESRQQGRSHIASMHDANSIGK